VQVVWPIRPKLKKRLTVHYGREAPRIFRKSFRSSSDRKWSAKSPRAGATDDVKLVESLANEAPSEVREPGLFSGHQDRASDIHFEPFETEFASVTEWTARFTKCRRRRSTCAA